MKIIIPIISGLLFLIILGYSLFIYLNWHNEDKEPEYSVEVSLPVIDWGRYSNLSKQYK